MSALTVALSLRHNSLSIAALGTLLGYLNQALIGSAPGGSGRSMGPFTYLATLSLAVLGVFVARQWSALRLAAFAAHWVVFLGWYPPTTRQRSRARPSSS